jgi:intergrase/recombinase
LTNFRDYLISKFAKQYAMSQYGYVIKYGSLMDNPSELNNLPISTRSNVLKALINLSKYQGQYENFKSKLKNYGIKWLSTDTSFNSFLAIINNNHSTLGQWYKDAMAILADNEKLFLKFTLLSGLRKNEALQSCNQIIKLANESKLSDYYNEELGILEHFKQLDSNGKPMFLRNTKNCYLSIIPKEIVQQIAVSQQVYYTTIRKHIEKNKLQLRIKELRSCYATYLRKNGILAEFIDLVQGRIPRSVFAKHYLKIEDLKELVKTVLAVTATIEEPLTQ